MIKRNPLVIYFMLMVVLVSIFFPQEALALGADDDFAGVVTDLETWIGGGLGIAISLAAVIVGALISIVRSNPLPILSGIAFAMILNFTPPIISNILTGII